MKKVDAVIIGAGPAGIAASIQLKRSGVNFLIIEKDQVGGLLCNANLVENYPGFPGGIAGPDLNKLFQLQLEKLEINVQSLLVENVYYRNDSFKIKTNHREITCRVLVVATGTKPIKAENYQFQSDCNSLVHYDVTPIRSEIKKQIVIIGGGDAAFDYALNLSAHNQVTILNRDEQFKCLPLLFKRTKQTSNIQYYSNTRVAEIIKKNDKLKIMCDSENKKEFEANCLLIAIGRKPNLDCLDQSVSINQKKLVQEKKLFLIGDVKNGLYRQTAICIGDGVRAAMEISETLGIQNL